MIVKRLLAAGAAVCFGLLLASCSGVSDVVADHWPHFAGGEPNGLPPRPGAPGYQQFIAHGQADQNTGSAGGEQAGASAQQPTGPRPSGAATRTSAEDQNAPGIRTRPAAADGVSGGLY